MSILNKIGKVVDEVIPGNQGFLHPQAPQGGTIIDYAPPLLQGVEKLQPIQQQPMRPMMHTDGTYSYPGMGPVNMPHSNLPGIAQDVIQTAAQDPNVSDYQGIESVNQATGLPYGPFRVGPAGLPGDDQGKRAINQATGFSLPLYLR